ncbi:hypothetical protein [Proteiniclasticum sp.]|uniref:hypothetical protein n=1 Tax=Proteiniclasticum sp. TaxID=2053595 RepID=UPI00289BAEB2|nr:hypothetical protein [Proteiniclasticum sp.]
MKIKTNQTRKDLIRNYLYILLGFFWIYGSMTGKFVHTRTNICLTIIRISLIVLGVVGVKEYYLQNKA